ncbi:MAG: diguanylate cyclase [Alphaproteobacteria bacterium]|nr:diguanylate cyclase [Alphaproteobacteria bacterium]
MPSYSARVLVYDTDPEHPHDLPAKLEQQNYFCIQVENETDAVDAVINAHPDVVIVNTVPADSAWSELSDAVHTTWRDRQAPVILIGDTAGIEQKVESFRSKVADYLPANFHDTQLFARLQALLRINTMHEELLRRIFTVEKYGVKDIEAVSPEVEVDDARVVLLGRDAAELDTLEAALSDERVVTRLDDPFAAMEALTEKNVDGLIVATRGDDQEFFGFCTDVRHNSRLFNLPILVIVDEGVFEADEMQLARGATEPIQRPIMADDLKTRLELLIIQQRYRFAVRKVFMQSLRPVNSDGLTGLYSHGFLHEHLASQVADAEQWQKHLAVGFFDIDLFGDVNAEFGYVAGDLLLRQIGTMISGLLRAEDLSARYAGGSFVVVLPETPLQVAEIALQRIASVVRFTELAIADAVKPISVGLSVGVTAFEAGDDAESLIARAREAMQ